jgi:hypothetical protein
MEESVHRARAFPFTNTVNSEQNGKSGNLKSNLAFLLWSLTLCINFKGFSYEELKLFNRNQKNKI